MTVKVLVFSQTQYKWSHLYHSFTGGSGRRNGQIESHPVLGPWRVYFAPPHAPGRSSTGLRAPVSLGGVKDPTCPKCLNGGSSLSARAAGCLVVWPLCAPRAPTCPKPYGELGPVRHAIYSSQLPGAPWRHGYRASSQ